MNSYFALHVQNGRNFAFRVQNVLKGIGKATAPISTTGKNPLHIGQNGSGSGKAVAVPHAMLQKSGTCGFAQAVPPGGAYRDMSHQEQGSFPRGPNPSLCLAVVVQPAPGFHSRWQTGGGTSRHVELGIANTCSPRRNKWLQELCGVRSGVSHLLPVPRDTSSSEAG